MHALLTELLLMQTHGFPKVMGVLTHLDGFKDVTGLKNTKKALKHRFWAEIYQGKFGSMAAELLHGGCLPFLFASRLELVVILYCCLPRGGPYISVPTSAGAKLFYLSGLRNGKYLKREVLNLPRFISIMKLRPLSWRSAHPYLLTDRFEVCSPITLHHHAAYSCNFL